jgi:hypothetical protein
MVTPSKKAKLSPTEPELEFSRRLTKSMSIVKTFGVAELKIP